MGQNPRKGVTRTWQDVEAELCDAMFTAMVALTTLTPDTTLASGPATSNGQWPRCAEPTGGTPPGR